MRRGGTGECLPADSLSESLKKRKSSLLAFWPAPQEGNHAWYWKPSQLPRASEVMDLGRAPIPTLF